MNKEYNSSVTYNLYKKLKEEDMTGNTRDYFLPSETEDIYNRRGLENANLLIKDYLKKSNKNTLGTVLEFGCGDGRVAQYMTKEFNNMICLDISSAVLNKAKIRLDNSEISNTIFELADKYDEKEVADFIYCLQVVQHNTQEEQFIILNKIKELLKPDGIACIHFPKLENKPNYVNHDTCMCFTETDVKHLVSSFSKYDIENVFIIEECEDYFVWVCK